MLNSALQLADLGYRVFPCLPDQKRPATSRGCLDATTDADQIERWWAATPNANIGVSTDGLFVLDVDGASNSWLADQPEKLLELAAGVLSKTPRGGSHWIFHSPAGTRFRNTAGKIAPAVDTRADGGYILVAPSIVGGKPYRWEGDCLDSPPESLAEPPAWLIELLDAPAAAASVRLSESVAANLIPDGQRNSTLTSLGGSMRRIGMGQNEILAALRQTNAERCRPPLDASEVEVIAWSVARYEPDQFEVASAEGWTGQDAAVAQATEPPRADPGPTPERLLDVPGFIGNMTRHILETVPRPSLPLAFSSSLSAQANLASRRVMDPTGMRPNLYLLALANSGVGKDHPRKAVQQLLTQVGLGHQIFDAVASGEALEDMLFDCPNLLLQCDEFHGMFQALKTEKDARREGVVGVMLKVFTSADGIFPLRGRAGQTRRHINQPALTIFGTSIPSEFYASMSPRMLSNGLFARLLIVQAGRRGPAQDAICRPIPQSIVSVAEWWSQFMPGTTETRANLATFTPQPIIVPYSREAVSVMADLRADSQRRYQAAELQCDDAAMSVWNRTEEQSRRLALNWACSESHLEPEVTGAAATWGADFARHQTEQMLFMAGAHVADGPFDSKCKRAVDLMRKHRDRTGDEWVPSWRLSRGLRGLTPRELDDVKKSLIGQGVIEPRTLMHDGAGRPGESYRIRS